ncbi:hypothetical protein tloyanaT_13240 [Thalassotalea loyana]|uniref:RNA polymerase sigma-70 region 4 domain-containing protein n=1 Tax=Thalassotalea loyana TaxID=280483 RepID=A0ABQ6HBU7_9GAMM|nr:hypothetical protein [Thalassotalea loyana]GLX85072.1 hypothetical protein tloyanaT_13240 [Thalassotalea loyana]
MPKINLDIDLALAVMCCVAKPGQTLNTVEIAEICGCSQTNIQRIEAAAKKKLSKSAKLRAWAE